MEFLRIRRATAYRSNRRYANDPIIFVNVTSSIKYSINGIAAYFRLLNLEKKKNLVRTFDSRTSSPNTLARSEFLLPFIRAKSQKGEDVRVAIDNICTYRSEQNAKQFCQSNFSFAACSVAVLKLKPSPVQQGSRP